jgi:hypothetical protein
LEAANHRLPLLFQAAEAGGKKNPAGGGVSVACLCVEECLLVIVIWLARYPLPDFALLFSVIP